MRAPRSLWCFLSTVTLGWVVACTASEPDNASVASIRFVTQPAPTVAGEYLAVSVEFLDAARNRVTSASDAVTLAVGFGSDVHDPATVPASRGVATFDAFTVHEAGEAQVLQATARGLSVVSLPFAVRAGPVAAEHSTVVVSGQPLVSNTPRSLLFTFADAFGNVIPRATVSLSSDIAGSAFIPGTGTTTTQGTFQATFRAPAPGSGRVSAIVAGKSVTLSTPVVVADACAPVPFSFPGAFSGVLATGDGCLDGGVPMAVHEFTTQSAGGVAINVNPGFTSRLEIRSDPATPSVWRLANTAATVEWLLPAGTYQYRISSVAGSGAYSASAAAVPANSGQVIRLLAVAGTYSGQALTTTDVYDDFAYSDYFLVYSTRPCTITIRSTAFDAFVLVGNATFGGLVAFDDNSGGGTDAQVSRPSCVASGGPVIIGVTSLYEASLGPYTMTVTFDGAAAKTAAGRTAIPR